VSYDFDPEMDFTTVKAYDWLPFPEKMQVNELTIKHVKSAVNNELREKGLLQVPGTPDILIAFHAAKEKKIDIQEWGYAYDDRDYYHGGYYPRRWHGEPYRRDYTEFRRGFDTYEYEVGTLILDFVDARTNSLIWRGTARGVIGADTNSQKITKVIKKILEHFPPQNEN
jgi:hypothetical protein